MHLFLEILDSILKNVEELFLTIRTRLFINLGECCEIEINFLITAHNFLDIWNHWNWQDCFAKVLKSILGAQWNLIRELTSVGTYELFFATTYKLHKIIIVLIWTNVKKFSYLDLWILWLNTKEFWQHIGLKIEFSPDLAKLR